MVVFEKEINALTMSIEHEEYCILEEFARDRSFVQFHYHCREASSRYFAVSIYTEESFCSHDLS